MTMAGLPPLGALQVLVELDRCRSLTVAAARLGVSRSALSHRMSDLEAQLGATLAHRTGRSMVLTDEGRALVAAMGDAIDRIAGAVAPFRRRQAQLRISTVPTFASRWLLPRLADFQARHPAIDLTVATTTRVVDLAAEDIDVVIRHGLGEWPDIVATKLFRETLMPVAAPDYLRWLPGRGPAELRATAVLIHARSREHDWTTWWAHAGRDAPPHRSLLVENRSQALEAAMAGSGIALMDDAYLGALIAEKRLQALAAAPIELASGYYVGHLRKPRNDRLVFAFRDWATAACA